MQYKWRVPIVLTPSDDGDLTDHRATLTIVKSTGSNAENIAYLQDEALNWPYDIRFTSDANGNDNLFFFRQEYDATDGTWTILVPSIAASGDTTIYMWYGKADDTDASNIDAVGILADHYVSFRGTVLQPETSGWERGGQLRWGSIVYDEANSKYYIFYTNGSASTSDIGRAEAAASNLYSWTKYTSNPIITDKIGPSVLKELDGKTPVLYDGKYWMAVLSSTGSGISIMSASALDGSWSSEATDVIVPGGHSWDSDMVFTCSFVTEGSTYYIVFQAYNGTNWVIGIASSSTPAGTYTIAANPILQSGETWENGVVADPVMRKFGNQYQLFYTGLATSGGNNSYATGSAITGPFTKTKILLCDTGTSYPEVFQHTDGAYYMIADDLSTGSTWKAIYVNSRLDSPFHKTLISTNGSVSLASSELLLNAANERLKYLNNQTYKRLIIRAKFPSTLINYHYFGYTGSDAAAITNCAMFFTYNTPALKVWTGNASNGESTDIGYTGLNGSYHIYEIRWKSGEVKFYVDGALKATHSTYVPSTALPVHLVDYSGNGALYVDWVMVVDSPTDYPDITPGTAVEIVGTPMYAYAQQ